MTLRSKSGTTLSNGFYHGHHWRDGVRLAPRQETPTTAIASACRPNPLSAFPCEKNSVSRYPTTHRVPYIRDANLSWLVIGYET